MKGVKAAQLAPSAINRHPVRFVYKKEKYMLMLRIHQILIWLI